MDVDSFEQALPRLFEDFPRSAHPRDRRFREILDAVPALTAENNLALLNLAAGRLGPDEVYLEVGSLAGASIVGAALGNEAEFIAIDDFSHPRASRSQWLATLERFRLRGVTLLEGDAFELLSAGALPRCRVGVFYYDALHSYEPQLQALRLIEPYLADRAVIVIDDADWHEVRAAVREYLERQTKARSVFAIHGKDHGQPFWWEGVYVLAWDRSRQRPATDGASTREVARGMEDEERPGR
jgi:protein O-GlcNAc transferase